MQTFLDAFNSYVSAVNAVLWHPLVFYVLLAVGLLFTLWSRCCQWRSLTQGVAAVRGRFDDADDPGAISHFQALSAALSATVGLGNIGGVGLGVALGGPGAVFWMWVVGILGMALKTAEVTLSMLYRRTDDPRNPRGGPMWVASRGMATRSPRLAGLGRVAGSFFCLTLLVSTFTGGNFFQAWNVGNVTQQFFGVPSALSGVVLATLVAAVILGGIRRIGAVAGRLVPFMCAAYLVGCLYVVLTRLDQVPSVLALILTSALSGTEAQGAFVGGTAGLAFATGLRQAFFSNEAGQGSSAIAHSAARTEEPAREGLVAGLEPFIDTLVVCTLTSLVIFLSGAWNRPADLRFAEAPRVVEAAAGSWTLVGGRLSEHPERAWRRGDTVQAQLLVGGRPVAVTGTLRDAGAALEWTRVAARERPELRPGLHLGYAAAGLTAHAFDRVEPGLGKWLVTVAAWLFALSTLIAWSYYGEQGVIFLAGGRWVRSYRFVFCLFIVIACSGLVRSTAELSNLSLLGTGCMLWANIPITLFFSRQIMATQRDFDRRFAVSAVATHWGR